jgi:uncharacterized SAM-binding protein YcdF (DUF218 family)
VGLVMLLTRFRQLASWLIVTSLVLAALVGFSPLGRILLLPLEQRFPPWDASRGAPAGIVVLGGAISPEVSLAHGVVALNGAAERITVSAELAHRYPSALQLPPNWRTVIRARASYSPAGRVRWIRMSRSKRRSP